MSSRFAAVALVALFHLSGCGSDEPAGSSAATPLKVSNPDTPAGALENMSAAFQANDIDRLLQASLPKASYDAQRAALESSPPFNDRDRQRFAEMVAQVSAPGAVDQVMAQVEPMLPIIKPQLQAGIAQMKTLAALAPPEHKAQMTALVGGLENWATANAFDAAQLRTALTALTDAFKKLELSSLDALVALPYEQKMAKFGQLLAGLKQALRTFDVDLDAIVGSLKVEPVSEDGDSAVVRTSITLFGAKLQGEAPMVRQDGRWVPGAALEFADVYTNSYGGYIARAHVAESLASAGTLKTAITEYYAAHGEMPPAGQFDGGEARYSGSTHDETGTIYITLRDDAAVNERVRNYQIQLTPQLEDEQISGWTCSAGAGLSPEFLPRNCR